MVTTKKISLLYQHIAFIVASLPREYVSRPCKEVFAFDWHVRSWAELVGGPNELTVSRLRSLLPKSGGKNEYISCYRRFRTGR